MAIMVEISSEQPKSTLVISILDIGGSKGNSAIFKPRRVSKPSSSKHPKKYNYSKAYINVYTAGGSIKSKFNKSFIPIAFNNNTVFAKFVLYISGTLVGNISFLNASSVYSLKHLPGPVLPALPALYRADA
jgi:hypothetical protein